VTQVKICGLKRVDDARAAAEAGADMLGFVFAPSRRRVEPELVREITSEVRQQSSVKVAGVFVNADPAEMNRIAHVCSLDYIQLSGDEPDAIIAALDVPAIQVIHVDRKMPAESLNQRISATPAELVLLDTARAGAYGGTGQTFDWSLIPELNRPILLAGGLHAENVGDAVFSVRPWGVDVSSGVETAGEKDHAKIRDFILAAKRA
jgi:phosphoribosylanthranilate isomerase